jgi:hypothetical protein
MYVTYIHVHTTELAFRYNYFIFIILPDKRIDGGWSEWAAVGNCSHDCNGEQLYARDCDNPFPDFCGHGCKGKFRKNETCNGELMNVNCIFKIRQAVIFSLTEAN